jgi:hypothetical protein
MKPGTGTVDEALYRRFYPYYAEICAFTELRKKPGIGVPIHSGMGGHCLLYLNGVQRDGAERYPVLKLCEPSASPAGNGVGISVNAHYKNANWVAAEGHDFLWHGALEPGERLTQAAYDRTQRRAKSIDLLEGVAFHEHLFRVKPAAMSDHDYMYEISIGTDYGARFGRDIFRARIPLDHHRMGKIVDYLNALNAPFRAGAKIFRWRVMNNNCVHVVHNALAAAGVWEEWPTGEFLGTAAFNFPVPKNEFVDLMLWTNDLPIADADALYKNKFVRQALLAGGRLPTVAGALATAEAAIQPNELYDVERLRLIFYDNPFWGPYRFRFARIFKERRYSDLTSNLLHFSELYATAQVRCSETEQQGLSARAQFQRRYQQSIATEALRVQQMLAAMGAPQGQLAEAAS